MDNGLTAGALFSNKSRTGKRVLLLGTGPLAQDLLREIRARPQCHYMVIGILSELPITQDLFLDYPVLGTFTDLQRVISEIEPDRVIVAPTRRRGHMPIHQLIEAKICKGVTIEDGEEFYEQLTGQIAVQSLTPSSMIFSKDYRPGTVAPYISRAMSLILAGIGLLVLAPLLVIIAIAIKIDSHGPVFFVQDRVGLGGRQFKLLKFRTMHPVNKRVSEWVRDNGHRITRIGKCLRKYRLDELPQFINVLLGDMNLVGPRPHPASNFELLVLVSRNTPECGGQIPYYSLRSLVRPGITGWAQVRYRYANDINEEIEKIRFDLYYVKHYSIWLDLLILFETIKVVVLGREAVETGANNTGQTETVQYK